MKKKRDNIIEDDVEKDISDDIDTSSGIVKMVRGSITVFRSVEQIRELEKEGWKVIK